MKTEVPREPKLQLNYPYYMSNKITAVIIDDEKHAISALKQEINFHCQEVEITGFASEFDKSIEIINELKPELIFLDIQLGNRLGFDLINNIKYKKFDVVFTTAYSQYAIKAIKFSALDYLLKPIDYKELIEVVRIFKDKKKDNQDIDEKIRFLTNQLIKKKGFDQIVFSCSDGTHIIKLINITYIESNGNYVNIYFDNRRRLTVSKTLKNIQEMLDENEFVRIHHSYIINLLHLEKHYSKTHSVTMTNKVKLPVSVRRSSNFAEKLKKINFK